MNNYDNDTRSVEAQEYYTEKEQIIENRTTKPDSGEALKNAARYASGGVVGAGAAMAVDALASDQQKVDEQPEADKPEADKPEDPKDGASQSENPTSHQERAAVTSTSVSDHAANVHTHDQVHQPTSPEVETVSQTATTPNTHEFYDDHEVEITTINSIQVGDEVRHVASGRVDGHEASFIDDGHGKVQAMAVDMNDNQYLEEHEVVDTSDQNLTMGNLSEHLVEVKPVPQHSPDVDNEVHVIAVETDVDMGGQTVDMAMVSVRGVNGVLIDHTQNGEIDIVAMDYNRDGQLSYDETKDVSDAHVPMPNSEDVDEYTAGYSELPDYSNDDDITTVDL